jgi:hypothetical protein
MSRNQLSFFATKNDLLTVLEDATSKAPFCFACTDEESKYPVVYQYLADINDLSIAMSGDQNKEKFYLLIDCDAQPRTRTVEQRNGENKIFFDQLSHPESVFIRPGGVMDASRCIIAGQVGTTSQAQWSENLYKVLSASFRKKFTKIKSFYVGVEAAGKLDQGVRLTTNLRSPMEYDLQR